MSTLIDGPLCSEGIAKRGKRMEFAPGSFGPRGVPGVLSVELDDDEEVRWHTTYFVDRRHVVTGYTIAERKGMLA